jgi:chromosome segregation ATPase
VTNQELLLALVGAGGLGAVVTEIVRWLLKRADRGETRQQALDKLEDRMREELRLDVETLRKRLTETELQQAGTAAKLEVVQTDNQTLRHENFTLKGENGELKAQVVALTEKANRQDDRLQQQGVRIDDLQADRLALIDAMRAKGIDIPPLASDRSKPPTLPGLRN